jgi:hypothetical protein
MEESGSLQFIEHGFTQRGAVDGAQWDYGAKRR